MSSAKGGTSGANRFAPDWRYYTLSIDQMVSLKLDNPGYHLETHTSHV